MAQDGAIVLVRVPGGHVGVDTLSAFLAVGERWGAPAVQLTSRGNLQVRALPVPLPEAAVLAVEATGLVPSASHERVRNILAFPLAGDLGGLVADLDAALQADPVLAGLPGRFLFAIVDASGSGLTEPWDLAYQRRSATDGVLLVRAAGRAPVPAGSAVPLLGMPCPPAAAVAALVARARVFLDSRSTIRSGVSGTCRPTTRSAPA